MLPQQSRYGFSAIEDRRDYAWPQNKRLAFWIGLNVEVFAFGAGRGYDAAKAGEPPTQRNYAWRDYGNRVGFWRLFQLFDELELPVTCLLNSFIYDHHPDIVGRIRKRGDEIVGHGRTNAEIQRGMWEFDERRLIEEVAQAVEKHEGARPKGWLGSGVTETNVTPDLLKEAGFTYVLDWPCDDQPIWFNTRAGKLLSIPYPVELNDASHAVFRQNNARDFADMIVDQFDEMVEQCMAQPLVFSLALHTHISGQPFRLKTLRQALNHIAKHPHRDRVWFTHAGRIADFCCELPPGLIPSN